MDRYEKLSEWILKEIEGILLPDEFHAMQQLLKSEPQALDFYVNSYFSISFFMEPFQLPHNIKVEDDIMTFDVNTSQLWQAMAEIERSAETIKVVPTQTESFSVVPSVPIRVEHRVSRMFLATTIVSFAAMLLLIAYVYFNPKTEPPVVGVLLSSVNARWADGSPVVDISHDLRAGTLALQQGLARIRFDDGASIVLEGPAEVKLLSGNSMSLLQGKIVATVGRDAVGFVVNTPQGKILDLGTEFGIQVDPAGQSQVHVFQGEVFLYPGSQDGHMKISEGAATSIDKNGHVKDIPLQRTAFVRQEELDSKIMARSGNTYYLWKSFIFKLHRDPSLAVHYFYTKDNTQPDTFLNAASLTQGHLTGRFGVEGRTAPTWVTGRWPEKSAVRFERGKNQAIVIPADAALPVNGPITISTWVYYPDEAHKGGHLISCRENNKVNFQFSIFDQLYEYEYQRNKFEFLQFSQEHAGVYSREFIQHAGMWYHFVVTYDMKNVCFYVNGKLFESKPYAGSSGMTAKEIILGAQKLNGRYVLPEGDFDGIVDELMIFNRSLSAAEIQTFYEIGLPVSK